jgi:hypothetical protein
MVVKMMRESSSTCLTRSPSNCSFRISALMRSDLASTYALCCVVTLRCSAGESATNSRAERASTKKQIASNERQPEVEETRDQQSVFALVQCGALEVVHEKPSELLPLLLYSLLEFALPAALA